MKKLYITSWTTRDGKVKKASCSFYVGCIRLGYLYCIIRDNEVIPVKSTGFYRNCLIDELLSALNESTRSIIYHLNMID